MFCLGNFWPGLSEKVVFKKNSYIFTKDKYFLCVLLHTHEVNFVSSLKGYIWSHFLLVMEKRTQTARSCCKADRAYLLSGNIGM